MKSLLFSVEHIESKRSFSDVTFSSKSDFSIKIELKNWVSGKYFFSRVCLFEKFFIRYLPERRILNSKSDFLKFFFSIFHCAGKRLLQNLILFFGKFHFKHWFSMKKFATKSCLLKWARKVKNLLLSAEQIESKRYFLDVIFFIEILFLNKKWTQNLIFRKILSPQNEFSNSILSKSARTKNSRFKNWSICRKKLHFKIQFFFQKNPIQNLIFNEKVYFKIMPFKISTKSEKFASFRGGSQIKTLFLRCDVLIEIWFLIKNWTQNLFFGNYFFSTKSLFKEICFRNLPERKTLN